VKRANKIVQQQSKSFLPISFLWVSITQNRAMSTYTETRSIRADWLSATEGPADAEGEGSVQVILNGEAAQRVEITNENSDVVHLSCSTTPCARGPTTCVWRWKQGKATG
jgi:hypothetical protein